MIKIKKGDEVIVIAENDKGRQGTVSSLEPNGKCFVSGVNMVKRHTKANPQAGEQGGIVEKESLIDISNISIFLCFPFYICPFPQRILSDFQ